MTYYYKINSNRVLKTKMGYNAYYQVKVYGSEYKKKDKLLHLKHMNKNIYDYEDAVEYGDKYLNDLNGTFYVYNI
jgi:hypothetical protein